MTPQIEITQSDYDDLVKRIHEGKHEIQTLQDDHSMLSETMRFILSDPNIKQMIDAKLKLVRTIVERST
jgi:cell division protein FtsB